MTAVDVVGVQKRFGSLLVLRGVELRVELGEVYGLLGPNGAGKSTLIHLLLGFLQPDRGRVVVLGRSPRAAQARVGYLPEQVRYHAHSTAREYLRDLGRFSNLREPALSARCDALLEQVGLAAVADRRIRRFSKGMLQRLGLAQAILHAPDLLLIDEPSSGLDPAGQHDMGALLTELRQQGLAILMCSHQVAELETLCDRVGVLRQGRIVAQARVEDVMTTAGVTITVGRPLPTTAAAALRALHPAIALDERTVRVPADEALQRRVLFVLLEHEAWITGMRGSGGLTEFFLRATRGDVRDHDAATSDA